MQVKAKELDGSGVDHFVRGQFFRFISPQCFQIGSLAMIVFILTAGDAHQVGCLARLVKRLRQLARNCLERSRVGIDGVHKYIAETIAEDNDIGRQFLAVGLGPGLQMSFKHASDVGESLLRGSAIVGMTADLAQACCG